MFYFETYFCYLGFVEMYFDSPIVLDAKACCEAGGWVNFLPLFEKCLELVEMYLPISIAAISHGIFI